MNKEIWWTDWGLTPYPEALRRQHVLFDRIKQIKILNRRDGGRRITPNYFVFTSHPHVYTLGKSGKEEHLLLPPGLLEAKGIAFYRTDRGGDITYHGPGQIVGYPVIDLDNFGLDIIGYIRALEEVIIRVLARWGLRGERSPGETGVWLDAGTERARKICAIGVRTSRWITMHGFALNVTTDLSYFDHIIPCGIRGKAVASMHTELGYDPGEEAVKQAVLEEFARVFGARMIAVERLE
ncbi:MAG: lipoyl(octanoyl) transferase LipB [Chlorobi bacterium]|nr:lipoyl(octanoyl) transferase LipB [Chlorobiota bacterium]